MFTGIVERKISVRSVADGPGFRRLTLANPWEDVRYGESIAVNGCCLTVAEHTVDVLGFDVIAETLDKTNLGQLQAGNHVNVERSLRVGDRFDGHFVQGHIDGTARLVDVSIDAQDWRFTLQPPPELMKYLVPKGSVAIDGVSLTLAKVEGGGEGGWFQVALIPTTLQITTLADKKPGWLFNLETDMMSKTIIAHLERFQQEKSAAGSPA